MTVGMSLGLTMFLRKYAATILATCPFIAAPCFMKADAFDFKGHPRRERPANVRVMDVVANQSQGNTDYRIGHSFLCQAETPASEAIESAHAI